MQVHFLINKGVKALFSSGGNKGANVFHQGQEGCYFVNVRAGRVKHPPERGNSDAVFLQKNHKKMLFYSPNEEGFLKELLDREISIKGDVQMYIHFDKDVTTLPDTTISEIVNEIEAKKT